MNSASDTKGRNTGWSNCLHCGLDYYLRNTFGEIVADHATCSEDCLLAELFELMAYGDTLAAALDYVESIRNLRRASMARALAAN